MHRSRRGVVMLTLVALLSMLVIVVPYHLSFAKSRGPTGAHSTSSLPPASGSATSRVCSPWRIVPSPNIGKVSNFLTGVAAVTPNDVWAVGNGGTSSGLVLHWNGSQWSLSSTPQVTGQMNLLGVAALSSTNVWAIGSMLSGPNDTLTTLTLHWDGSAWSIVPSPNVSGVNSGLNAIAAIAPNDIWAVGNTVNASFVESTLAMHWDGSAWTIISTPDTSGVNNVLNGVAAIATNDVWAVGEVNGTTLADHWNGSSWSVVATPTILPNGAQFLGISAFTPDDVWAVGGTFGTMAQPATFTLAEHWTGSSWQVVSSPSVFQENTLYGVGIVPGTHQLWAVGSTSNGTIGTGSALTEQWNGTVWTLSAGGDAPGGDATLFAVAADVSGVWVVGTNNANLNLTLIEYQSRLQFGIACP